MSRFHFASTSRALYRVFVAPNLAPSHRAFVHAPLSITGASVLPFQGQTRSVYYRRKPAQRHSLTDYYTFDNAINASHVNLVDENGVFHTNVPILSALKKYNRVTHHLLLVDPGTVDEFGTSDPADLPTCKVTSKIDLRNQFQKKVELKQREETGKLGTAGDAKKLELNWAIAGGDLTHRLSKLQDFLLEGRKVDVTLGPKRRGKEATRDEATAVLKAIRDAVLDCKGAGETKEPDGVVGGVMTLFFEGKDLSEKKPAEKVKEISEEPVKSKFREKFERKQKEEEEKKRTQMEQRARERPPPPRRFPRAFR